MNEISSTPSAAPPPALLAGQSVFLRIEQLRNANYGAETGSATIDRPTQLDAVHQLPYVPNSALRGVLRAAWLPSEHGGMSADAAFGQRSFDQKADDADPDAGLLFLGNGELLCFPILTLDGKRCRVFSLLLLGKLLFLSADDSFSSLLKAINEAHAVLALPSLPLLPSTERMIQLRPAQGASAARLLVVLEKIIGHSRPTDEYWLIANEHLAAQLWQNAVDTRAATALQDNSKSARAGSLRYMATVPQDTVFISFATWRGTVNLPLPDTIMQIGAREADGLGFCRLSMLPPLAVTGEAAPVTLVQKEQSPLLTTAPMEKMYKLIQECRDKSLPFRKKLRTVIFEFGVRAHREGMENSLAFSFAKARAALPRPAEKPEPWAHRVLLGALLDIVAWNAQTVLNRFASEIENKERIKIMARWHWLRRFAEYELENEEG